MNITTRILSPLLLGGLLVLVAPMLRAQDPVFEMTISAPSEVYCSPATPESTGFGATVLMQEIQTSGGGTGPISEVSGYSIGIAHDPAHLSISSFSVLTISDTGQPPIFAQENIYSDGFTLGAVFSFTGDWTLTYESPTALVELNYNLVAGSLNSADSPTATSIAMSDLLGIPPVANVAVVNSASMPMVSTPANVSLIPFTPEFELSLAAPATVYFPEATPAAETFSATVNLQEMVLPPAGGGEYSAVQGGSFGVGHDSTLMDAAGLQVVVASDGGLPPDFAEVIFHPDGVTLGLTFSNQGDWTLSYGNPAPLATIDYQLLPGALTGTTVPTTTTLSFTGTLGNPQIQNVIVVDGESIAATLVDATVDLVPFTGSRFIRGDSTQDGNLDLADGIGVLAYLFQGSPTTCLKALDMNHSDHISISDGVLVLCSLFCAGSPPPSAPYPDCGVDLVSSLTCDSFTVCP